MAQPYSEAAPDALLDAHRDLLQRAEELAAELRKPIDQFLELPGDEAGASFKRIVSNIGEHPLIGVSALGGLVSVFAYIKALRELRHLGIHSAGLVSTSDIGDFAARLAVPFILLVVAFIVLVLIWATTLQSDHRRKLRFTFTVGVPVALFVILYFAFCGLAPLWLDLDAGFGDALKSAWKNSHNTPLGVFRVVWPPDDLISGIFLIALVCAVVPAIGLLVAGLKPGVYEDDRVQLGVLTVLRKVSTPTGLLVIFSLLGVVLLFTDRVSVLPLQPDPSAGAQATADKILESKQSHLPMLIKPRFARLSTVWLVQSAAEDSSWFLIASGDVACIRALVPATEKKPYSKLCNNPPPPPEAARNLPISIARYASTLFGCNAANFESKTRALVIRFARDEPRAKPPITSTPPRLWWVGSDALTYPGLAMLGIPSESPVANADPLIEKLQKDKGTIWVLGFASSEGGLSHNRDLSQRRAQYLLKEVQKRVPALPDGKEPTANIKYRGLGADALSGLLGVQYAPEDQIAVAFWCS